MASILLICALFILSVICVQAIFHLLTFFGNRAFHRKKLREALGADFKHRGYAHLRKEPIFLK